MAAEIKEAAVAGKRTSPLPSATPPGENPDVLTKATLQQIRSLRDKKVREAEGLYIVEGAKVVAELLTAGMKFEAVYATAEWKEEYSGSGFAADVTEITAAEMAKASHYPTPSAILAVGRIERVPLPAGALNRGVTLALDGVQDPGNVGTLMRIADWYRLDRVILSADCADLFHQKTINASMGSFGRTPAHVVDLVAVLRGVSIPILGCDLDGENVHTLTPVREAVIVIGSEGAGLSGAVEKMLTRRVTIPRFGTAESLNAAIAAAIVCDNLRRQQGTLPASDNI